MVQGVFEGSWKSEMKGCQLSGTKCSVWGEGAVVWRVAFLVVVWVLAV